MASNSLAAADAFAYESAINLQPAASRENCKLEQLESAAWLCACKSLGLTQSPSSYNCTRHKHTLVLCRTPIAAFYWPATRCTDRRTDSEVDRKSAFLRNWLARHIRLPFALLTATLANVNPFMHLTFLSRCERASDLQILNGRWLCLRQRSTTLSPDLSPLVLLLALSLSGSCPLLPPPPLLLPAFRQRFSSEREIPQRNNNWPGQRAL